MRQLSCRGRISVGVGAEGGGGGGGSGRHDRRLYGSASKPADYLFVRLPISECSVSE